MVFLDILHVDIQDCSCMCMEWLKIRGYMASRCSKPILNCLNHNKNWILSSSSVLLPSIHLSSKIRLGCHVLCCPYLETSSPISLTSPSSSDKMKTPIPPQPTKKKKSTCIYISQLSIHIYILIPETINQHHCIIFV